MELLTGTPTGRGWRTSAANLEAFEERNGPRSLADFQEAERIWSDHDG